MQKLVKPAIILYFLALFIVIWTYIAFSDTSVDLRMHVATTSAVERDVPNLFAVWAYEKDMHYDFSGWSVEATFLDAKNDVVHQQRQALDRRGFSIVEVARGTLSRLPIGATFSLIDPEGDTAKQLDVAFKDGVAPVRIPPQTRLNWVEPGTFLLGENSSVIFDVNKVYDDEPIVIRGHDDNASDTDERSEPAAEPPRGIVSQVVFGRVGVAPESPVSSLGLSRIGLKVETSSDLVFSYGAEKVYGTFTPNELPLRIEISQPVISPDGVIAAHVRTMVGDNRVTFNFYERGCWIGRTEADTDSATTVFVNAPAVWGASPKIVLMTGCLSAWSCGDMAHQVALIATPKPMSLREQTEFALKSYAEAEFASQDDKENAQNLVEMVMTRPNLADEELALARDYALARIANGIERVEPVVVARSEVDDKAARESAKASHRKVANPLFLFIILTGVVSFVIAVARTRVKPQFTFGENGEFEVKETKTDRVKRRLMYLMLAVMGAGTLGAIFYVMQLL